MERIMALKGKKGWAIGATIVLCILVVLVIAINLILPRFFEEEVRKRMSAINPNIHVSFTSLQVNILSSSLRLNNLQVSVSTDGKNPENDEVFSFRYCTLRGIRFLKAYSEHKLVARKLELEGGRIALHQEAIDKLDSVLQNSSSGTNGSIKEISLHQLTLDQCDVSMKLKEKGELSTNATVNLFEIHFLPGSKHDSANSLLQGMDILLNEFRCPVKDSAMNIRIKALSVNSMEGTMKIDSFYVTPNYGKIEYAHKLGHQVDRIDAKVGSIACLNAEPLKMLSGELKGKEIIIQGVKAEIFRDRRVEMKMEKKPMPLDYLKDIPLTVDVNKLTMKNANLSYEEFPKDGDKSGTLKIENLQMSITPFINQIEGKQDHLIIEAESSIMDAGQVNVTMQVPLSPKENYYANGAFTGLKLVSLDGAAKNLGGIHIESGVLDHLSFEFSLTSVKSSGKIIGEYHNLVLDKLKKDDKGKKKPDPIKSFALQHLIIPKDKDKSLPVEKRTGKVDFTRDQYRNFPHYLLHSLLSGIKASFDLGFLLP